MFFKQVPIDALVYRGDTRKPSLIFRTGFKSQFDPEYVWEKLLIGTSSHMDIDTDIIDSNIESDEEVKTYGPFVVPPMKDGETQFRLTLKNAPNKFMLVEIDQPVNKARAGLLREFLLNEAWYRTEFEDISPKSAVCLTRRLDVAPYFPIEGSEHGEWTWVYAARLSVGVDTYSVQESRNSSNVFALELATQFIPHTHVIAAIRCRRKGKFPAMKFYYSPRIRWNPYANGYERFRAKSAIESAVYGFSGYDWDCPTSTVPDAQRRDRIIRGEPRTSE